MNTSNTQIAAGGRIDSTDLLCPKFRAAVLRLHKHLIDSYETGRTKTRFEIFETYRSPIRQSALIAKRTTKAGPWQSPHQFGLATDFVPYADERFAVEHGVPVGWNWHPANDYSFLAASAQTFGLTAPIPWDQCHIEHPSFQKLRKTWRTHFE